ncbi:hypothetical protein [Actinacidiphila oryziradicis]|uniref:Uncharacterized protein n=1 Tax=Actinacidiphila oryziradicis TaxID=2571141 RepID=A0A4U0RUC5_9ACTN|nr:hypothetical protein [Actinacidiphila oryziradicis]TJZ99801.1 hypothetical protein FCI23_44450 [Actinacidiphila oryziradicis]
MISLPVGSARIRRQAVPMYALLIPALTPFVLLGTIMGLSWLEDHIVPPAEHPETPVEPSLTPAAAAPGPESTSIPVR